jgi:hypothetical protein
MIAILRVDHCYAEPSAFSPTPAQLEAKAGSAVDRLAELTAAKSSDSPELARLRSAGRMVVLAYRIAAGKGGTIESVREQLGVGDFDGKPRATVGAAAYYDAACAVSLLLARAGDDAGKRKRYTAEGLWMLETSVAATVEARRPRVRELARTDPMLDHLEQEDPARFAKALGEPPPKDQPPASVGDTIARALAAALQPR